MCATRQLGQPDRAGQVADAGLTTVVRGDQRQRPHSGLIAEGFEDAGDRVRVGWLEHAAGQRRAAYRRGLVEPSWPRPPTPASAYNARVPLRITVMDDRVDGRRGTGRSRRITSLASSWYGSAR